MASTRVPPRPYAASDRELSSGLKWSLIAHLLAATLIVAKSIVFPGTPKIYTPTLRVDIVGLPDLLKKDAQNVPKAPVSNEIEQALKKAEEQAKQVKALPKHEEPKEKA